MPTPHVGSFNGHKVRSWRCAHFKSDVQSMFLSRAACSFNLLEMVLQHTVGRCTLATVLSCHFQAFDGARKPLLQRGCCQRSPAAPEWPPQAAIRRTQLPEATVTTTTAYGKASAEMCSARAPVKCEVRTM